jgi:glycosidase
MARVPGGLKAQVAVAQSPFRYLFRLPEGYWGSHGLEKALPRYDRFFHLFAHPLPPEWALGTVYALLFAFPGSPAIYYGDEIGLSQPNPYEVWAGDPHCRAPSPWDEGSWDRDLLRFLKRLVHLKKTHPALRQGGLLPLRASEGVLAFRWRWRGKEVLAYFAEAGAKLSVPRGVDLLTGQEVAGEVEARYPLLEPVS